MVTGLQRIWMLCLLVIAGSGPLPLWLHHIVCHGHNEVCQGHNCLAKQQAPSTEAIKAGKGKPQAANAHQPADHCCGHQHGHIAKSSETAQSQLNWQPATDSHEDCAVCYTLSQLTTAEPANDALVGQLLASYLCAAGDSQASLNSWLAYSSRGPPAV